MVVAMLALDGTIGIFRAAGGNIIATVGAGILVRTTCVDGTGHVMNLRLHHTGEHAKVKKQRKENGRDTTHARKSFHEIQLLASQNRWPGLDLSLPLGWWNPCFTSVRKDVDAF